ncbi:MAG: HD domain-containing phosphohydrolase [Deferribacterales bacterium]
MSLLVTLSVIGTLTILALSTKFSESALHMLADEVILRSVSDATEHVNIITKPALNAVNAVETLMPSDMSILDDDAANQKIISNIIKTMESSKDVYTAYYSNANGEFFLVGKRQKFENDKKIYYFNKIVRVRDGIRTVTESWYNGTVRFETNILTEDSYDPRTRPWYQLAETKGMPVWSPPYTFFITGQPGITYSKPIYHAGELQGVVASDLEIKTISDFLLKSSFTTNTSMFVIDSEKNILAHSDFSRIYSDTRDIKNIIPKASGFKDKVMDTLADKYMSQKDFGRILNIKTENGQYKAIAIPANINGMNVILGMYTPAKDYLAPLYSRFRALIYLSVFILVMVIIICSLIARELAKPFVELSRATEKAKELHFDSQINICTNFKEVSATQENFNEMLTNLNNYKTANELFAETLHNAHVDTLYRLAGAAEHKDQYTYDHLKRVSDISVMIAEITGMNSHAVEQLRHASVLHDVGKLGIPDDILMKPGKLTKEEFDIIKKHPELGAKILADPSSEIMHNALIIAKSHHEKWDGTGYPLGLSGDDIPLIGRIVALADVIDALLSRRPYKEPFSFEVTIEIVEQEKGKHFDPELAQAVLDHKNLLRKVVSQ